MALKMMQTRGLAGAKPATTRGQMVVTRAQTLSAGDLAVFKIIDLVELAAKKGCSPGRNATRDSVVNALVRAGVSASDLTKGQLADLKQGAGSSSYSSSSATSSGDRFANYSRSSSASSTPRASAHSGGATLSAGDLSAFKIVDLVEIAGKKGVQGGRNATRDTLVQGLVRAGVSLNDLSRGQLVDLGIKLGKAGLSRDINQARAELASLIGGSGSAPSSWRSTPTPAASSGDRFASYSSSRPAAGSSGSRGSGSPGAKLGAGDLAHLPIDDLRDLVKKLGTELPREPTRDNVISGLVQKGVSLGDLTRGMLVALSTKLGAPLAKDVEGLKRNLSSLVGGSSGYSGSSSASASSWRSTPAAAAPAGGDRWSKYSAGSTQSASWRRSGSHNASGSKLSSSDLAILRIDDLRDLSNKTGTELPREPTKDGVISALINKGVSLNDLTRGMLVDLANKLSVPLARDVDSLRKSLSSAVGKGGYSPAASSGSNSSWRTTSPAPAASNGTDRWSSYSRSAPSGGNGGSAGGNLSSSELNAFKIDTLSELARKKGISMRNATKQDLVSQLSRVLKKSDLSKAQLNEMNFCLTGARR
jgi:hypothetical protein